MPTHRRSPALPWDLIGNILSLNWCEPVDLVPKKGINTFRRPGEFYSRCCFMEIARQDMLTWMMVSKDANAIASKLFYSCIAVYSSRGLGKFRELVESRQPSGIGSLVRSLQLHRFEREDPEEEPTRELWWWEMCRLVRLLPNLVVLRGGSNRIWGSGELQVLAELLSSPPRPFRAFENLQVDSNTLPLIISLLQYSSETLQYLSFTLPSGSAVVFPHHPSTYPLITFPSLTRISFRTAFTNHHLLLPIATSRWSFPVLRSVETTGSPSLSPFLRVHGSKVKELGFISQPFWDDNSYEECLDLCPNLETLGWLAWEPKRQNPHPVQLRPLDRAVVSVRRIEVGQHLGEENHRHDSFVNSTVPPAITKAAFPSLERVVFKTGFLSISKHLLAWGKTLTDQGVVVEWE